MRRVVVSGIGVLCAIGRNREEFTCALRQGRCGVSRIDHVERYDLRFENGA